MGYSHMLKWVILLSCLDVPSVSFSSVDSFRQCLFIKNVCSEKTHINGISSELLEKLNGLNSDHSLHSNLQPFSISFIFLSDYIYIKVYVF